MVIVALYFWSMQLSYPSIEWSKYTNCIVTSLKYQGESGDILPSSLNSLLLSGLDDAIITARDPMQNPGQT